MLQIAFTAQAENISNHENIVLDIESDDRLVLYSDGIIEIRNRTGDFFGEDPLEYSSSSAERAAMKGDVMYVIRIEHPVPNFEGWKKVFDSDPLGRKKMGVRRYRIQRALDNLNHIMLDLEFDTEDEARAMLAGLQTLWGRIEGTVMSSPRARIVEQLEEETP